MASVVKLATPGVYVQEISTFPPSVAEVETAIAAFIGYTQIASRGGANLTNVPTKVTSYAEYQQWFGDAPPEGADTITVDVKHDANGNYVVSLAQAAGKKFSPNNLAYAVRHFFDNGGATCYIVSVGAYADPAKDALIAGVDAIEDIDEVTLLSVPEAAAVGADYKAVALRIITQAAKLQDRFALVDPPQVTNNLDNDAKALREATLTVKENRYAAAYYPNVVTMYGRAFKLADIKYKLSEWNATDQKYDPAQDKTLTEGTAEYSKIVAALQQWHLELPPSPGMAGLYARVDSTEGVWKAPANEILLQVDRPSVPLSDRQQAGLNIDADSGKSINAIRTFPGYGPLVWGARTLNGNDNEWRYISVRRFFIMVEESIKKSIQWAVFEPNTIDTWVKVQAMIENYLVLKWKQGALAGQKQEQAFYVKVGLGTTMTAVDILEGRMNVEIGMAVARPAEFIVLKFSQIMQQS